MKRRIYLLGVLAFVLTSCSDFLDYNENSEYDRDNLFNTTWSNANFVTGIYAYLPGSLTDVDQALRSSGCDESEFVWSFSGVQRYSNGSWSPTRTVDDQWGYYYKAIRACNDYLAHGTGKQWDEFKYTKDYIKMMRTYNNRKWEVKALRAYYYFELVKRYNSIPLITKVLTEEEANKQVPVSYQTVISFIADECDEAVTPNEVDTVKLPATYGAEYNNETGRVSKVFALALKARALLYAASPLNNPESETNSEKWIKAAQAAKAIIDSADEWGLSLVSFNALLGPDNWKQSEMILAKRLGDSNILERTNFPIGLEGGNSGNCPTQNLVDAFGMKRGQKFDPKFPYKNRDPRLAATVLIHGAATAYGKTVDILPNGVNGLPKEGATKTGYYLSKFVNNTVSLTAANTTQTRHSFPLFRYAEILLIYAEAMNEAYGPDGTTPELDLSARQAINKVRARSGLALGTITVAEVADKETFKQVLRTERMAELAFEDHRFWDIRRWKIGSETTEIRRVKTFELVPGSGELSYEYYSTNDRIWDEKMNFYPIPQSEIYKNHNLKQNPGWN